MKAGESGFYTFSFYTRVWNNNKCLYESHTNEMETKTNKIINNLKHRN